jgi:hypothetical protein
MDLNLLTERAVATAWRLAGSLVQSCTYVVPAGFNPATGLTQSSETRLAVQALVVALKPREWDLVQTQPGDERVLLRVKELGAVVPVRGDYLLGADAMRRDVQSARKGPGAVVWVLLCTPNQSEDWGDLTAATVTDDWGDLATVTASEDWGLVA